MELPLQQKDVVGEVIADEKEYDKKIEMVGTFSTRICPPL